MEERSTVVLKDLRKIVLDEDEGCLHMLSAEEQEEFSIEYTDDNYGGGSLMLSPSEKYLLFSCYSGESEEAFFLYEIEEDLLNLVYESGYSYGEQGEYAFSKDERFLVQTVRLGFWCEDTEEEDEDGERFYKFGELNVLDLKTRQFERHTLHVYPGEDWEEEVTDDGDFFCTKFGDDAVEVLLPWGEESFTRPLDEILVIK